MIAIKLRKTQKNSAGIAHDYLGLRNICANPKITRRRMELRMFSVARYLRRRAPNFLISVLVHGHGV